MYIISKVSLSCPHDDPEVDANDTSGELGSALPGCLVGESEFRAGNTDQIRQLILSASGGLVVNNTHCRNWRGDVHVGNEQLCIIHSNADGQFF